MTTYQWATIRAEAIDLFNGELPNAITEQDIIDAFEQYPTAVIKAMRETATAKQAGKVRSGWAIWRKQVLAATNSRDATASDEGEREKKLMVARVWIRNAGCYLDREKELIEALFGPDGFGGGSRKVTLQPWDTPELRAEMVAVWEQHRGAGERAEREADESAAVRVENRREFRERLKVEALRAKALEEEAGA